jgi:hypothetical protein
VTYNHAIQMKICDDCHRGNRPNLIEIWRAGGGKHYCEECWPHHRNYYEDEGGRQAWKRVGNRYTPTE